jgi:hypothetical protein
MNIVAITNGAKTIRLRLSSLFGDAFVLILDWYHLCKKLRNLMSMIAINKEEKSITTVLDKSGNVVGHL